MDVIRGHDFLSSKDKNKNATPGILKALDYLNETKFHI
jgi:hypothetical protein